MKHNKLMAVLAGAIALTSLGSVSFAAAQRFNNVRQSLISSNTEFKMNELTPAEEAQQWQEMKQKFIDAGINLTPQQETIIRQAQRKLASDMLQLFQDNPLMTLGQLIAASSLPQKQGEEMMKATGLDEKLGYPLIAYRNSVLNALTPKQRPVWEKHFWNREGQARSSENSQINFNPPDPAEQARQWEAKQQRFRDAGVPLTLQQEAQMQATEAKLQADLNREFQANPTGTFARFVAVALLPAPITEQFAEGLLGQSVITHFRSVNQILTPAQQRVWDQGFSNQP